MVSGTASVGLCAADCCKLRAPPAALPVCELLPLLCLNKDHAESPLEEFLFCLIVQAAPESAGCSPLQTLVLSSNNQ